MRWLIIVVVVLLILGVIAFVYFQNKQYKKISFKETLELTGLPIITFHHWDKQCNDIKLNFLLDTGASHSIIDKNVLDGMDYKHTGRKHEMCGLDGIKRITQDVAFTVTYEGKEFHGTFQVDDMTPIFSKIKNTTGVSIHGVLGSTFFNKYRYIIDFDKYITYSKTWRQ